MEPFNEPKFDHNRLLIHEYSPIIPRVRKMPKTTLAVDVVQSKYSSLTSSYSVHTWGRSFHPSPEGHGHFDNNEEMSEHIQKPRSCNTNLSLNERSNQTGSTLDLSCMLWQASSFLP